MMRSRTLCLVLTGTIAFSANVFAGEPSPIAQGMTFSDARKILIQQRWKPVKAKRVTEPFAVEKALLHRGVIEVESCSVDSFCIFRYSKGKQCMKLVARGESLADLTVLLWDYRCP